MSTNVAILDYGSGNLRSAQKALREAARRLADLPQGYPLVPRYERYGIRRRSYRRYGILYRPEAHRILILRFLGPGQDHDRALQLV